MQSTPRIWLGDDGIMRIEFPQDYLFTLKDVQELNRQHREIRSECGPLLVYAMSVAEAEHEAKEFASSDGAVEVVSAMAILVKSVFTRAMADIFMKFNKPPYPTRIFTSEADALAWLEPFCASLREDGSERGESA
ncbi:hypothetical protein DFR30_0439 [Thiogranum longum]|uniref:DUF7793 domain-containing protein n=1 Tax=Thiogranum longum TaxID=1537524 RepID=A0A4R1H7P4_9GAMM|nr:hypothetical protein [Thiogranum longum]TCK17218.1 hypothetical protein DFR30_0439 [Thiogranum longum]